MTLNSLDCIVMNRKTSGDDATGPVEFRNDPSRMWVLPDDQILRSHGSAGETELDHGPFHFESAVGAREQGVQLAHAIGARSIESLAGNERRKADFPGPQGSGAGSIVECLVGCGKIGGTGRYGGYQDHCKKSHKVFPLLPGIAG